MKSIFQFAIHDHHSLCSSRPLDVLIVVFSAQLLCALFLAVWHLLGALWTIEFSQPVSCAQTKCTGVSLGAL